MAVTEVNRMSTQLGIFRRPSPLPVLLTSVIGRECESAKLRDLLLDSACRIVTVIGPAGIGKTRLALHVAEVLAPSFEDNVAFVKLSSIHDVRLIFPAIGQEFGLLADLAVGYDEQLLDLLRDRPVLLVLDNCEQLPDAREVIGQILTGCPDVTVLATSQAPIGLSGEQLFPLASLSTPSRVDADPEEIERSDAVALFLSRARAVNPYLAMDATNAAAIAEICRYLDGLPLAIELAAARSNILSPPALLARLTGRLDVLGGERRDVPDRQRTMRQAISWSYDLLAPEEQQLFRRLSVFEEHFSLDAVEAIFDSGMTNRAAIDVLGSLVDRSLVRRLGRKSETERYLILRTLRDYGLEQLAAVGEEHAARLAHAQVMTQLAESAEPHLILPDQDVWLDRLDDERANLRAAIEWSLVNNHEDLVFRIAGSIWRFYAWPDHRVPGVAGQGLRRPGESPDAASDQSPYRGGIPRGGPARP
jgi:predicted ATPase